MKTVFITCIRGIITRNILSTAAFELLASKKDLRLVIIVPESRRSIIEKEFVGENVLVESISNLPPKGLARLFWVLSTSLLSTRTREVQRRAKFEQDKNFFDYIASRFVGLAGRFRVVRWLFRFVYDRLDPGSEFDGLFKRFRPSLLFATDVYELADVRIMRAARRLGVKTIGMVRSWDNPTSKTILNFIPDYVVVNAGRIRDEAIKYGDVPAERIFVSGVPHYDRYLDRHERTPRREFCQKFGLGPDRPVILFTPPSDRYLQHDPVTPIVLKALETSGVQVLVRMPLVGSSELVGLTPPPDVVFDLPSNSPDFVDVHLDSAADRHLADSIWHSSLVITWASTMVIDAAAFDKPIILVGFDASHRPYGRSIQQYYDYDHQRAIILSGGVRLANTPEELIRLVSCYLADPALDKAGREKIRNDYCGRLDGRAGERLGKFLLERLGIGPVSV